MSKAAQHFNVSAFDAMPRPALAGKQVIIRNGVRLEPLFGGHILHVLGKSADGELTGFVHDALGGRPFAVRAVSPGQLFVVGDKTLTYADTMALADKIKARADIVDQSHGRVRILLQGRQAARVLVKGTAVDVAPQAFLIGQSAMTLMGHIGAHITRTGEDRFEIIVLRGFAESLWDDLNQMSREFN